MIRHPQPHFARAAAVLMMAAAAGCGPALPPSPTEALIPSPAATLAPAAIPTPIPSSATPQATATPLFPPIAESDWAEGPSDAPVAVVAYCDFQSRGCAGLDVLLDRLMAEHPDRIRRAFRHLPDLAAHDKAVLAAEAAEAAGAQGHFWAMHDWLFATQMEWTALDAETFRQLLIEQAPGLGLDAERFSSDLDAHTHLDKIDREYQNARAAGVPGPPFLLFNGEPYAGPGDWWSIESLVRLEILKERQFAEYPPMTLARGARITAILRTTRGDVTLELYPERAPLAVNSFVFLARHGWYDGMAFHHVLPGFSARTGDPTGTGLGGPGYAFGNEISPSLRFDRPGRVAMFNAGPGTNGSQFFITYSEQPNLDGAYTIFGQVVAGMDALNAIPGRNPDLDPAPPEPDSILSVEVVEQ